MSSLGNSPAAGAETLHSRPRNFARRTIGRRPPSTRTETCDARITTACARARLVWRATSPGVGIGLGARTSRSAGRSENSAVSSAPGVTPSRSATCEARLARGASLAAAAPNMAARISMGRSRFPPPPGLTVTAVGLVRFQIPEQDARRRPPLEVRRVAGKRLGQPFGELAPPPAFEANHLGDEDAQPGLVLRAQVLEIGAIVEQPKRQIGLRQQDAIEPCVRLCLRTVSPVRRQRFASWTYPGPPCSGLRARGWVGRAAPFAP